MSATEVTGKTLEVKKGGELKVTPVSEWRKPYVEGVLVQMPSGKVVKLRPVGMDLFVRLAKIPDTLTPVIARMMGIGKKDDDEKPGVSLVELKGNVGMFDEFAKLCIIEPKVVDTPEFPDEIGVDEIDFQDKEWLLGFLNQPARVLEAFRQKPDSDVEPVDAQPVNGSAPVETASVENVG